MSTVQKLKDIIERSEYRGAACSAELARAVVLVDSLGRRLRIETWAITAYQQEMKNGKHWHHGMARPKI